MTAKNTAATPDRESILLRWLERVEARCLWTIAGPLGGDRLQGMQVNGKTLIVHWHAHGWELYRPASTSSQVSMTLDEAAVFCGTLGSRGLDTQEE